MVRMSTKEAIVEDMSTKGAIVDNSPVDNEDNFKGGGGGGNNQDLK